MRPDTLRHHARFPTAHRSERDMPHGGDQLRPVGGRIVGEVPAGIIDADPESFRSVAPDWTPTLPAHRTGAFGLADILVPRRFRR
jgi:hypothetical protein